MHARALVPLLAALAALLALSGAPLPAQEGQGQKFVVPGTYERATTTDEEGLLQWAPYEAPQCPNCEGRKKVTCPHCARFEDNKKCIECEMTKEATCRACTGLGHFPDPLEKVHCPGCMGAGFFACFICGGRGVQKVTGSGDRIFDCVGCKGDGGYRCGVCKGERLVEVVRLRPSLDRAKAKDVEKAREEVAAALEAAGKFEPSGGKNARKDVKDYLKLVKDCAKVLPPMKRAPKAFEDVMKEIYAGSIYIGHEENEANAIRLWKANNLYYLAHQQRLLELALARAEHNEKVLEDKK